MAYRRITINSIDGGIGEKAYGAGSNQYLASLGIDHEYSPQTGSALAYKTPGNVLMPVVYSEFSDTDVDAAPLWIMTNPKNTLTYAYLANGKFFSYDSDLDTAGDTALTQVTSSTGNGACYYNNYIYLAKGLDVARYGPLDGTPALDQDAWTSAVLGSQTVPTDPQYPVFNGVELPNHPMHVHNDNQLYFGDVAPASDTTNGGHGLIHAIKTTSDGTNAGVTDDGSAYNVLDLPSDYYPTAIESYGDDLVIAAIQHNDNTNGSVISQGKAALFFWDTTTTSSSFYLQVNLPDPLVTALKNVNGIIYIWSGNARNGFRISTYTGGRSIQTLHVSDTGYPPFQGAVDAIGNRLNFAANKIFDFNGSGIFSFNSKHAGSKLALHNVAVGANGSTDSPLITAVKSVVQDTILSPTLVSGWKDGAGTPTYGLEKPTAGATNTNVWRSRIYTIGRNFRIKRLRIQLTATIGANIAITPVIVSDPTSASSSTTLTALNNTNYSGKDVIVQYPNDVSGNHSFYLQLTWSGTDKVGVILPIEIDIEIEDK